MNFGSSHPKTSTSSAITIAGLSKRLPSGLDTGAGDVSFTGALARILKKRREGRPSIPWKEVSEERLADRRDIREGCGRTTA
jgi:hypothetical protein